MTHSIGFAQRTEYVQGEREVIPMSYLLFSTLQLHPNIGSVKCNSRVETPAPCFTNALLNDISISELVKMKEGGG